MISETASRPDTLQAFAADLKAYGRGRSTVTDMVRMSLVGSKGQPATLGPAAVVAQTQPSGSRAHRDPCATRAA
ncbi:hypothetical protein L083_3770 [Actinoplanes sp. N902-109]|nr:hypothetical protein L083_3770 [Actinoplanes sp. N902-109]